jgi:hypothetical protein
LRGISNRIVQNLIKDRLTTETDRLLKGDRVIAKELIQKLSGDVQAAGGSGLLSPE